MLGKQNPKYSGPLSRKFWDRINSVKPQKLWEALYVAGCALQDHEGRVLEMLKNAEMGPAKSSPRPSRK